MNDHKKIIKFDREKFNNLTENKINKLQMLNTDNFNLFSTQRPKHLLNGIQLGVGNFVSGLSVSIGSLILFPILGSLKEGFNGFIKGMGAGLISSVVFFVGGVGLALTQSIRGCLETPTYINEGLFNNKTWDDDDRIWVNYDLDKEYQDILNTDEEKFFTNNIPVSHDSPEKDTLKKIKNTYYYDVLNIKGDASQTEIRKAYHILAKEYHPDKQSNQGNANSEQFNLISNAYTTLSDPKLKYEYDHNGINTENKSKMNIDSNFIFSVIFANEKFIYLLGQLNLELISNLDSNSGTEYVRFKQKKREVEISLYMLEFISKYDSNQPDIFINQLVSFKNDFSDDKISLFLLDIIGEIYLNNISDYENYPYSILSKKNSFIHKLKIKFNLVSVIKKSILISMENKVDQINTKDLNIFIELIWTIVILDIEKTLKNVIKRLMTQFNLSNDEKKRRIRAFKILGKYFRSEESFTIKILQDKLKNYIKI